MNIICLGLSHHTAGVDIRERFAISPGRMAAASEQFFSIENVAETVIVSTCNRVEFYAAGPSLSSGYAAIDHFLKEHSGLDHDGLEVLYRYDFPHSANHLFRVVCGLDSMVLGETEILGQVKTAYQTAVEGGVTSKVLNKLFQRSFQVAKQVRTHTGINRGSTSVGSVAVDLAGKIFGNLGSCRAMIIGAGENSERTARSLISRGVKHVLVANRSYDKAKSLADTLDGRAISLEEWESEICNVDIIIASTAAPHPIITHDKLKPLLKSRHHRPLFLIDIAVPRDIDPAVNDLENVYLYDMDSLQAIADRSIADRKMQLGTCEHILRKHTEEFHHWMENGLLGKHSAPRHPRRHNPPNSTSQP